MESIKMKVYQHMCIGCESEKRCHESCETCEEFEDKLQELAAEEEKQKTYALTIDQILEIIDKQQSGEFCRNNCYGCYGDDHPQHQCEWCKPKMKEYLEKL